MKFLPLTTEKLEQIRYNTEADEVLQELMQMIQRGWPENKQYLQTNNRTYYSHGTSSQSTMNSFSRAYAWSSLKSMRKQMIADVHNSHIGFNGCIRRAQKCMFWPNMTADLKAEIALCETCNIYTHARQQKETLMSHEPTDRSWENIAAFIYRISSKDYLIVVDYFSNF